MVSWSWVAVSPSALTEKGCCCSRLFLRIVIRICVGISGSRAIYWLERQAVDHERFWCRCKLDWILIWVAHHWGKFLVKDSLGGWRALCLKLSLKLLWMLRLWSSMLRVGPCAWIWVYFLRRLEIYLHHFNLVRTRLRRSEETEGEHNEYPCKIDL